MGLRCSSNHRHLRLTLFSNQIPDLLVLFFGPWDWKRSDTTGTENLPTISTVIGLVIASGKVPRRYAFPVNNNGLRPIVRLLLLFGFNDLCHRLLERCILRKWHKASVRENGSESK
jgi:hypothetical protein